jgi:hypothetical protein
MMIVINVSSCERVRLVQFLNRNRSQQICVGCGRERRKYCQNEGPMRNDSVVTTFTMHQRTLYSSTL